MSFLAPFYLLAGLAIGLPILFHLIRRTPQGRQVFSSLMFLSPSPPRMTQRRRIDDWLLMFLRIAAILLLAAAFARPFIPALTAATMSSPTEEILVLLDRSASMQRPGYWERALQQVRAIIQAAGPRDSLQVQLFDTSAEPVMTFAEWDQLAPAVRSRTLLDRIDQHQPGWGGTLAGRQLLNAVGQFRGDGETSSVRQRLVLISDMQAGGGWEALSASTWPEQIPLQVLDISRPGESNASVHLATDSRQDQTNLRVRLSNAANSSQGSLTLRWKESFAEEGSTASVLLGERIEVAPGQSRMVAPPSPLADEIRGTLELAGDDVTFDNLCYVVRPHPRGIDLVYVGSPSDEENPQGLRFFLAPLFPDDLTRTVRIIDWKTDEAAPVVPDQHPDWIIIGNELAPAQQDWMKRWLQQGGEALFVARNPQQAESLYELLGLPAQPVEEATVTGHVLLGKVALDHPVLQQFRDPRFSDFTKLRFWKYRKFDPSSWSEARPEARVLAEFEEGTPALVEIPVGKGRVMLLASGWNRDDSDLAVWSKFVPLMNTLLETACRSKGVPQQWQVGESLPLTKLGFETETILMRTRGLTSSYSRQEDFRFTHPGFYQFALTADALSLPETLTLAVNLTPDESRTEPYPVELLAAAGIPLQDAVPDPAQATARQQSQRQLLHQELEAHQQWWRWLLTATLILVGLESMLAVWKSRRQATLPT